MTFPLQGARRPARALTAAALACAVLPALAARPLVTEDAGVLETRACEAEVFTGRQRETSDEDTAGAQLGCGVGAGTQVAATFSRARETGEPATRVAGLSAKVAVGTWPGTSVAWAVAGSIGHERAVDGAASELASAVVLAGSGQAGEHLAWHVNVGVANSRPARVNTTTWNVAVEHAAGGGVDLAAEVFGDDRQRPWVGAGVRFAPWATLRVHAALAAQPSAPRARQFTLGATLAF